MAKIKLNYLIIFIFIITGLVIPPIEIAYAHSGRTDAAGCHHVRKTGEYHCHTPKVKKAKESTKQTAKTKSKTSKRQLKCKRLSGFNRTTQKKKPIQKSYYQKAGLLNHWLINHGVMAALRPAVGVGYFYRLPYWAKSQILWNMSQKRKTRNQKKKHITKKGFSKEGKYYRSTGDCPQSLNSTVLNHLQKPEH